MYYQVPGICYWALDVDEYVTDQRLGRLLATIVTKFLPTTRHLDGDDIVKFAVRPRLKSLPNHLTSLA